MSVENHLRTPEGTYVINHDDTKQDANHGEWERIRFTENMGLETVYWVAVGPAPRVLAEGSTVMVVQTSHPSVTAAVTFSSAGLQEVDAETSTRLIDARTGLLGMLRKSGWQLSTVQLTLDDPFAGS